MAGPLITLLAYPRTKKATINKQHISFLQSTTPRCIAQHDTPGIQHLIRRPASAGCESHMVTHTVYAASIRRGRPRLGFVT